MNPVNLSEHKKWENEYDKYKEYLESKAWSELRNARLKLDDYCCQNCGNPNNLEVHHLKYPDVLGTEPLSDLITLCHSCHKNIDDIRKMTKFNKRLKRWESYVAVWVRFKTLNDYKDSQCIREMVRDYCEDKKCEVALRYYIEDQQIIGGFQYISKSIIPDICNLFGENNVKIGGFY